MMRDYGRSGTAKLLSISDLKIMVCLLVYTRRYGQPIAPAEDFGLWLSLFWDKKISYIAVLTNFRPFLVFRSDPSK